MNTLRRTIVGFFSALMGRSAFSAPPNSKDPASLMRGLRDMALSTPAAKLGFKPTANFPRVFGVVMDWAVGDETVSIVGFADGTASLYASSGGGVIGGQGTTAAREAAQRFVRAAESRFDEASPVSEHPYPAKDKICFYLRTYSGLRMIEADANSVESGKDKYSPLFGEGQMVLTALRIAAE